MARLIDVVSAELIKYNANNRGKSVGDCVKRALSLVFDMDYSQVAKELNIIMKDMNQRQWNIPPVFDKFIADRGGSRYKKVGDLLTVEDFADGSGRSGRWLVRTSDRPGARSNHILPIIDGNIFDSWDSSQKFVTGFYEIPSNAKFVLTDIKSHFQELAELAYDCIDAQCASIFSKNGWTKVGGRWSVDSRCSIRDYKITIFFESILPIDESTESTYSCKVAYIFKPTMTLEEAERYVKDLTKVRVYDRLYETKKQYQKDVEVAQIRTAENISKDSPWMTQQEERFYNTLPGWAQARVKAIYVQNPGNWSDSYQLKLYPLPGDSNRDIVLFEGYTADDIRGELDYYYNGYERLFDDYSFGDRF